MNTDSIITITVISIIALTFICLFIYKSYNFNKLIEDNRTLRNKNSEITTNHNLKKMSLDIESEKIEFEKSLTNKMAEIRLSSEKELSALKDAHRQELRSAYDEGFDNGVRNSQITVQITPTKKFIDSKNFFRKKSHLIVGYKYQLFSNGIPCLEPHEVIVEDLKESEINQKNIDRVLKVVEGVIERIPNSNLAMQGGLKEFAKNLKQETTETVKK